MKKIVELNPDVKKVVISGGEPMLQQSNLITLLNILKYEGYWVEIETNGTIEPKDIFLELIDQINCSPKTSNSGEDNTPKMRDNPVAMKKLVACEKTNFKFVLNGEEDIWEINSLMFRYGITKDRTFFMPQAKNRLEYFKVNEKGISLDTAIQVLADRNGHPYTSRLQVLKYDNERGR
jgi:organic radical activating enzyme